MNEINAGYVKVVLESSVRVRCNVKAVQMRLKHLGGRKKIFESKTWEIPFSDEGALAELLQQLRDLGFPMSGGSGWPPSEVFRDLRDKNLVSGKFKEILWKARDDYVIYDNQ